MHLFTPPEPERPIATVVAPDHEVWDASLERHGGHLLQSWAWGEFKQRHGWNIERVHVKTAAGDGYAQILFRCLGPVSIGYVPRGPVLTGDIHSVWCELTRKIDAAAKRHRAISLVLEPDDPSVLEIASRDGESIIPGPPHVQPRRTVKMALDGDDEMLARMHHKTRYNVRLAGRRGVEIEQYADCSDEALDGFYSLLTETSGRNAFAIHDRAYYADVLRIFGGRASLFLARNNGELASGIIAVAFGDEAIYLYGGSSTRNRGHGSSELLQFEAARWARDRGCARYDLWGIPDLDSGNAAEPNQLIRRSSGSDLGGLYRFKTGFGGDISELPATIERAYVPFISKLARHVTTHRGKLWPVRKRES